MSVLFKKRHSKSSQTVFLLSFLFFFSFILLSEIQAGEFISVDAKVSYVSKYMWRGFDLLKGDPAIQPEMTLNLGESGFYLGVWTSFGTEHEWSIWDEWDYYGGYATSFFKGQPFELGVDTSYTYFHYPNLNKYTDSQEVAMAFKLPSLLAIDKTKLIPYWSVYRSFEAHKNPVNQRGWWVKLGMEADQPIEFQKDQILTLYTETFWNDGAGSMNADKGFSHLAMGAKTSFDIYGFSLTPGLNYQWSWEDTVDRENEFWYTLSLGKSF